jgi:hypothetical protein
MSNVTIKISNEVVFDANDAADVMSPAIVGDIINRMDDGIGLDDGKMRDYSKSYKRKLERMGEDTKVDHRVTGLMLSQVKEIDRSVDARDENGVPTRVTMTFGVDGGGNRNNIAAFLQALRPWFGLSRKGQDRVAEALTGERAPSRRSTRKGSFPRLRDAAGRFLKR